MIITSKTDLNTHSGQSVPNKSSETIKQATQDTQKLPEPVSDHLFLNNIRPEQAREFLLNQINRKLAYNAPDSSTPLTDYATNLTTAADTQSLIVASIQRTQYSDSFQLHALTSQVNSGFQETREILQNLDAYDTNLSSEFNAIHKNVNSFINSLQTQTS